MFLTLFSWWWDSTLGLPRAQVVTGIAGIVVGLLIGVQAFWIARKQKEMQEEQHLFFLEQRDNRPSLELWITGMNQVGSTTRLTCSVRNGGKAVANGFSWEIVLPIRVRQFASFTTANGHVTPYKFTSHLDQHAPVNFFKKDVYEGNVFVGDMVDIAWIAVVGSQFRPFQIQWRIYAEHGTVPEAGHNTISITPRPEGLLNVQPVLTVPAVTSGNQPTTVDSSADRGGLV